MEDFKKDLNMESGVFYMSQKLLSDADIEVMVSSTVDEIKAQMQAINQSAANSFYSVGSGTYNRTGGFSNLGIIPEEQGKGKKKVLIYRYVSSDLTVNEWLSPWGVVYPGNPDLAFETGFVNGLHGGPRPAGKGGKWSWANVKKTEPIWEMIADGVRGLK